MSLPDLSGIKDIRSILVIRYFALGDIALSIPIIDALREGFPEAHISYLCWDRYSETLSGVRSLDSVLAMENSLSSQIRMLKRIRKDPPDLLIDLLSSPGSALITRFSGAGIRIGMDTGRRNWCYDYLLPRGVIRDGKNIRCYTFDSNLEIVRLLGLWPSDADEIIGGGPGRRYDRGFAAAIPESKWADDFLRGEKGGHAGYAGIVVDAKYHSKSWPLEYIIEVVSRIENELGLIPVLLWGPGEKEVAEDIARQVPGVIISPPAGIAKLGALISKLDILVGVDSGPKHLAVLQGVPTVTIFGPTDPAVWDPGTGLHKVLYRGLDCSPCRDRNCRDNICMKGIKPDDLIKAMRELLDTG